MSFSVTVKNELAHFKTEKECCRKAELVGFLRMGGNVSIGGKGKISISMETENAAAARKMFTTVREVFGLKAEILMYKKRKLRKNQIFIIRVPSQEGIEILLKLLGLLSGDIWGAGMEEADLNQVITGSCCARSYLRGVFLGGGSINNPEGNYHLEITTADERHCHLIVELLSQYDIAAKTMERKNSYIVYLKESDQIVEFLNVVGAHHSLLEFENTRVMKDMRNRVNRLVNCETANLNKLINASMRQAEDIRLIDEKIGIEKLPLSLREIARIRLEFPESSYKELGDMMSPPLGKSGVNHRMRKLTEIADDLRGKN